jgi:hypothetical protein
MPTPLIEVFDNELREMDLSDAAYKLLKALWEGKAGDFSPAMDEVYDLERALKESSGYDEEDIRLLRETDWAKGGGDI